MNRTDDTGLEATNRELSAKNAALLKANRELRAVNAELLTVMENKLAAHRKNTSVALDNIDDAVIRLDHERKITYANSRAIRWFENKDYLGKDLNDVFRLSYESSGEPIDFKNFDIHKRSGHVGVTYHDHERQIFQFECYPFCPDSSGNQHVVLVMHDVTLQETIARKIQWQSQHDSLTGLLNRCELLKHMRSLAECQANPEAQHALLFIDMDQFKVVNDTAGHLAGDELLRQLAAEMRSQVRSRDRIARLGGDEFAVLLENCSLDRAEDLAGTLVKHILDFRFSYQNKVFRLGASIGIAFMDSKHKPEEVLSQADRACYNAKHRGRNCYVVNRWPEDSEATVQKVHIHSITKALDQDRYEFFLQEIQPLSSRVEQSYWEVLIRMLDNNGNLMLPNTFLPVAERFSHMHHIDRWVIRNISKALSPLEAQYGPDALPVISINISGQSLSSKPLRADIPFLLADSGLPMNKFCIEITETAAISNFGDTSVFLNDLHERGCKIALDDFGSGMASFNYIRDLPMDIIKIDGSIVRDIEKDQLDHTIVQSIQQIADVLDCYSVAEFVETSAIRDQLKTIGVDYVQGFAIGRPECLSDWVKNILH